MASAETEYPPPTRTGTVPFTPSGDSKQYETYYSIWGDITQGIPLICLHGGPGCPSQYLNPLGLLYSQFGIPVITYDQLGSGKSTHLRERRGDTSFWTIDLFVQQLQSLILALGIKEYDVYGHSWGGIVLYSFAFTQPVGLRKLILHSAPGNVQRRIAVSHRQRALIPGLMETVQKHEAAKTTSSAEYQQAAETYFQRHLCTVVPAPECMASANAAQKEDDTVQSTLYGGSGAVPGPIGSHDIESRLHEITNQTVPGGVLLINGEHDSCQDEVVRPVFVGLAAKTKWIKYGRSSHMPFFEETEKFMVDVAAFLGME